MDQKVEVEHQFMFSYTTQANKNTIKFEMKRQKIKFDVDITSISNKMIH